MGVREAPVGGAQWSVGLYQQVLQFYARQMQLLDSGEVEAWACTFAEDGVLVTNAQPGATVGRGALAAGARQAVEYCSAQGVRRRHVLGTVAVTGREGARVSVRFYVLLVETPRGGRASIVCSAVGEDVLELGPDGPAVLRREVSRDDLV